MHHGKLNAFAKSKFTDFYAALVGGMANGPTPSRKTEHSMSWMVLATWERALSCATVFLVNMQGTFWLWRYEGLSDFHNSGSSSTSASTVYWCTRRGL